MHQAMNACVYTYHTAVSARRCISPAAVFTRCNFADSPYPVKKHVAVIVLVLVVVVIVVAAIIIITSIIVVAIAIVTATVAIYRSSWVNRGAMECIDEDRAICLSLIHI